jgi:hypothetical protein
MQTKNSFSFQRFILLLKLSLQVNKKLILISLSTVTGTLFIGLWLLQSMVNFEYWDSSSYMTTFFFIFLILGFIYTSKSFPAFRSTTKSLSYLMLPVSNSEKYVFEFLTRVLVFIVFMPILFWIVSNIEGRIVHSIEPQLVNYKFSFFETISKFSKSEKPGNWGILAIAQSVFFVFAGAFTGASHFSKSPLVKTLLTFSTIVAGYFLYSMLLFKGLHMKEYEHASNSLFLHKNYALIFTAVSVTLINITLLAIAWFSLKEKEA